MYIDRKLPTNELLRIAKENINNMCIKHEKVVKEFLNLKSITDKQRHYLIKILEKIKFPKPLESKQSAVRRTLKEMYKDFNK